MKFKNVLSGLHLAVLLSVAALIVFFSYLLLRSYHVRFDLSEGRVFSLSPASLRVIEELRGEPVRIIGFFREDHPLKRKLEDLADEYAYRNPNLTYEFHDPDRMPAKAKQYEVEDYETVVVEAKGKRLKTRTVSEQALTALLAKLNRDVAKKVVFATGYGGPDPNDNKGPAGYGLLKSWLVNEHHEVHETVLLRDGVSPDQADVLVIGGSHVDLLPEELNVVRQYLKLGGRVLIMMDPVDSKEGKNLEDFLADHGVELGENVVVDKLSKLFGADYLIPLVTEYGPHRMTEGFELASFFPIARTVRIVKDAPSEFETSELARTGAGSWAETDLAQLKEGTAEFDESKDQPGPLPIAVAVSNPKLGWRLVVFGDSDFATNAYLHLSGNRDFILNAFAWLAGDDDLVAVRPRERKATPLFLREVDQQFLFLVPVLGVPILFLSAGTVVYFWRRRYH